MIKKIFFTILFFASIQFSQDKNPKIASDFLIADFGKINQNENVYTKFEIYNRGSDTLRVKSTYTSSLSVQTRISKKIIAPADSAELYIQYNPDVRVRKQMEFITVVSNAKNNPKFQLTIRADVKEKKVKIPKGTKIPIIYFPETTHNFGKMKKGKIVSYLFKFINEGEAILKIKNVKTSSKYTTAVISRNEISPRGKGEIKVEFDSVTQLGKTRRSVRIISNDPIHPKTYLNIFADVIE
ncbi:MAG TPA: DUF1573 domain-containing protein [Ignavibacteria bacterium]|nr:DUF1573 domain-containing protein [Ignavibacteria bacterium]